MALNEVQNAFVQNAARPHMETIVRILHLLDTFPADYAALQAGPDALPTDAVALDDERTDAPALSGADIANLSTFSAAMSAVVGATAKEVLIGLMVRDLNTVLGLN